MSLVRAQHGEPQTIFGWSFFIGSTGAGRLPAIACRASCRSSLPSVRIVVVYRLRKTSALPTPCSADFASSKQLSTVSPRSPSTGSQEKALAFASAFSTKSADRGRNPPAVMKSLRDEILLRRDRRGGFLLVLFIFHYSPFIIHFL